MAQHPRGYRSTRRWRNPRRLLAPAHPGCAGSDEDDDIETIDDLAFRMIETMDALGLERVDVAGACVGGWIAAELAVRWPERVSKLALIGASGLFVKDQPMGDLFWEAQPRNGSDYSGFRRLLFARDDHPAAISLFPDDRSDKARELQRYKMMRFASRIGFHPPYFYDRLLRRRLHRFKGPALLIWGEHDRMVPRAPRRGIPRRSVGRAPANSRGGRPQPAGRGAGRDGIAAAPVLRVRASSHHELRLRHQRFGFEPRQKLRAHPVIAARAVAVAASSRSPVSGSTATP